MACLARTLGPSPCKQLLLKLAVQLTSLYSRYQMRDLANHPQCCVLLTMYYKIR